MDLPHLQGVSSPSSWPSRSTASKPANSGDPNMAPFSSPEDFRRSYSTTSNYESLSLKINPPRVVVDNTTNPAATIVKVDSANRHGCLLEVVQLLTDLDLVISKAYISSDGGWFVDEFHVTDQLGNKVVDENLIEFIQLSLGARREVQVREVHTCLGKTVSPLTKPNHTAIELTGTDRLGLLSEISTVLTKLECNVIAAEVWTHNSRVAIVVYVNSRATGGPIHDPFLMNQIKEELRAVMELPTENQTSPAKLEVSTDCIHTERRLHQLMHAERDYEIDRDGDRDVLRKGKVFISVRNCPETLYSIVEVRCIDRPKLFFDTVCTLTDMKYVVFHASIDSDNGLASQEYYIRHMDGCTLDSEEERERVVKSLEAAIARRVPQGIRLELCTGDRIGLLSDVTRVFAEKGLTVTRADVATQGGKAVNVFYVTESSGKPVDMDVLEAIQSEIGHTILQVKEVSGSQGSDLKAEEKPRFSLANLLRSQSERFLLSLGIGSPLSSPQVSREVGNASTRW